MYNKILAIDFETANSTRGSVCSLGYALFQNDEIENREYLIDPEEEFDWYNVQIHGITPEKVEGKKKFPEVWSEVNKHIDENTLVIAHNASFDMSVIRYTCDKYQIKYPEFDYVCTWKMSKKYYDKYPTYSLDYIAKQLRVEFIHHNAKEDAYVCLKIFFDIIKRYDENIDLALENFELKKGKMFSDGYIPCGSKSKKRYNSKYKGFDINSIISEDTNFDKEHPFYDKIVVFTGRLNSLSRKEAMQKVVNVGGHIGNSLTKKTDYLVMGIQDLKLLHGEEKSNKIKKAEKYIEDGSKIELIDESIFLKLL